MSGGSPGPHKIQGIGAGFIPENFPEGFIKNPEGVDEVIPCKGVDAIAMSKRMVAEEGMMVGISSGAAAHVAIELAKKEENAGKTIVFILPSFGERYLSSILFAEATEKAKALPTTPVPE